MAKIFIILGIFFIIIGVVLYFFKDFPLFHLPGDIMIKKENFTFYFPLTSSILISVIFSLILYLVTKALK